MLSFYDYGAQITWQSEPDFDSWGPDSYWSGSDWILWHKALKSHYGPDQAKSIFLSTLENGSSSFGHETFLSLFDNEFRTYFKNEGFESNIWDKGVDVVNTGADAVTGAGDFIASVTANMGKIVIAVVIVIAVIGAAYAYNTFKTDKS